MMAWNVLLVNKFVSNLMICNKNAYSSASSFMASPRRSMIPSPWFSTTSIAAISANPAWGSVINLNVKIFWWHGTKTFDARWQKLNFTIGLSQILLMDFFFNRFKWSANNRMTRTFLMRYSIWLSTVWLPKQQFTMIHICWHNFENKTRFKRWSKK